MKRIVIGSELSSGYFMKANYKDQVVLAQHENEAVPEPFVVWYLDEDGDPHTGSYFSTEEAAQKKFAERAFRWYEVPSEDKKTETPEAQESSQKSRAIKKYQEECRTRRVMEEIYYRIIFGDTSLSRKRKIEMLRRIFSEPKSPSYLMGIHMEAFEKVYGVEATHSRNNITVNYDLLPFAEVSRNNRI